MKPVGSKAASRLAGAMLLAALCATTAANADVSISAHKTKNMSCVAGVCSPTAKGAVLSVKDLVNLLKTSDMKVTTGAGAVTVTISDPLTWTTAHRLSLDAFYNVPVSASQPGAAAPSWAAW